MQPLPRRTILAVALVGEGEVDAAVALQRLEVGGCAAGVFVRAAAGGAGVDLEGVLVQKLARIDLKVGLDAEECVRREEGQEKVRGQGQQR